MPPDDDSTSGKGSRDRYAVRVAGQAVTLRDRDALEELARTGQIGENSEVRWPGKGWVKASEVPLLATHFEGADPWDAWESMEESSTPPGAFDDEATDPTVFARTHRPDLSADLDRITPSIGAPGPRRGSRGDGPQELPDSAVDDVEPTLPPGAIEPAADSEVVETEEAPPALRPGAPTKRRSPKAPPVSPPDRIGGQAVLPAVGGKVIAFPRSPRPPVQGANALQDSAPVHQMEPRPRPPRQAPRPKEEPEPQSFQWKLPVAAFLLGAVLVLGFRWYVATYSGLAFPEEPPAAGNPPPPEPAPAVAEEAPVVEAIEEEAPQGRPHAPGLEDELRGQLMESVLDVGQAGDLDDALLIELRRVRLEVMSTNAEITSWTGRRDDAPEWADFRLRLRTSEEDLERDLAGVALVVGKYIQHYSLQVEVFEVHLEMEDGLRRLALDPDQAAQFFLKRISMEDFLESGVGPAGGG